MKRTAILFLFVPLLGLAQRPLTQVEMRPILDSILLEADMLYRYEKSALSTIKFAQSDRKIRKNFTEVFTYMESDTIRAIILDKYLSTSLAELSFYSDYSMPVARNLNARDLSEKELRLLTVRQMIYKDITRQRHEITIPNGYDLHSILLPFDGGYKLYMIMAAKDKNVVPFGNDHLFISDKDGTIINHEKFHSRVIPSPVTHTRDGLKLFGSAHTHLETVPFITATDICIFRIYCENSQQKELTVISTAMDYSFKYNLIMNNIEIIELKK